MNIRNFKYKINSTILQCGREYFKTKMILSLEKTEGELYSATVKGSKIYNVSVRISGTGEIISTKCNCPYDHGEHCKHIAAVLYALEKRFDKEISTQSSNDALRLINDYSENANVFSEIDIPDEEKIHIIPELTASGNELQYSLTIGRTRMYVVKDILKLKYNFDYELPQKYGKELEFVHTYNAIDEKSRQLLDMSLLFYSTNSYYVYTKKEFSLQGTKIDTFFTFYKDEYISFDHKKCLVKFENPKIELIIKEQLNDRYSLKIKSNLNYYGKGIRACFFDNDENVFYITTPKFAESVCKLFVSCKNNSKFYISKNDMTAFYSSVLKQAENYLNIKGLDLLENYIPPELVSRLYLDCNDDNEVIANLEFTYDNKIYPAFYEKRENPLCDHVGEKLAEDLVLKYFKRNIADSVHPLVIYEDSDIYNFLAEGLPKLTKIMEVYGSQKFKGISLRPPVKPTIGIRPSGNLLELDITAEGFSMDELVSILSSYRKGNKYHRLRDGSFALMDDSLSELSEFTSSLNITDKALLKEKINVPQYRMLYLDSLKSNKNFRLERSNDFKKAVRNYNAAIEDSEVSSVPKQLQNIMREYQKYGFRWMKTISSYGFGGILADDMGLGKTIQAIALMLDEKKNSNKHRINLVVCPSSLTLNWEHEIHKFAPELKAAVITGTATQRNLQINQINEYDVVITSYSIITRDIAKYEEEKFYIQFIDEAQYIKNHNTQAAKAVKGINSEIRFALTGTPVENTLAELWSIFDFIMPEYLFGYTYFKKTFESPIVSKNDNNAVKALQKIVSPFILRRLKKDVLTELPEKTETILYAKMESEQSQLYSANVIEIKKALGQEFKNNNNTDKIKILAMLTRIRQICCDPSLVYENYRGSSAKLEQCMELIENCLESDHKILLFSQFTSMLDIIADKLNEKNISYYMLTGKTKPVERIKLVNSFNSDDTKVFLISLKAGGTGLNLTGADIVIHYDPWWNESAENQASDRAYRIGQKRNVQIYKLITDQTIEENILRLQQSKSELYDIAVGGNGNIMQMSTEDIIKILE